MSAKKRGFIEIVGDILQSINEAPLKKSHISFNCNLDPRSTTKYLKIMGTLGLVEKSKDLQHYILTEKGIKFLKQYNSLTEFLSNGYRKN